MSDPIYGVVLAGGGGTRLWPASRRRLPKQLLPLAPGGDTLLGATVERLRAVIPIERILVVTAADQAAEVARALPSLPAGNILAEPLPRNTAPCIGLAALEVERRSGGRSVLAVVPSDQYVADEAAYGVALAQACQAAQAGYVATIGIRPTRPETGFGYIEMGPELDVLGGARAVSRFVEKPDRDHAAAYVASGRHLWNSGMFFFQAERILGAIHAHMPELAAILDELRTAPSRTAELYPSAPSLSIDYGVMERLGAAEVVVVPGDFGWNDVGSWTALHEMGPLDGDGNVRHGDAITVDARENVLYAARGQLIAAVGVSGLVIVATRDAVLVLPRERAQDVREIAKLAEKFDTNRV